MHLCYDDLCPLNYDLCTLTYNLCLVQFNYGHCRVRVSEGLVIDHGWCLGNIVLVLALTQLISFSIFRRRRL